MLCLRCACCGGVVAVAMDEENERAAETQATRVNGAVCCGSEECSEKLSQ